MKEASLVNSVNRTEGETSKSFLTQSVSRRACNCVHTLKVRGFEREQERLDRSVDSARGGSQGMHIQND